MSNNLYTFLAIISAGVGMVICRILPYIIFANGKLPKLVKFYEKYLPFSLMAILFCLCLSTVKFSISLRFSRNFNFTYSWCFTILEKKCDIIIIFGNCNLFSFN